MKSFEIIIATQKYYNFTHNLNYKNKIFYLFIYLFKFKLLTTRNKKLQNKFKRIVKIIQN